MVENPDSNDSDGQTKSLQLSGYRAAGNGVQLSLGRVEDKCYIGLFF